MVCQDTTPIAFSFTDLTELAPVGVVTSDTVTPLGFEGPLTLTCTNCSALAKNGSFGGTSLTGVNPGDTITVRATAPSWNGTLDVTVQLGLSSTVWNLRSRDYQYIWLQGGFGGCTASCGGGVQTQVVSCQREDGVIVADAFCLGAKPPTNSSCNTVACPPSFSWGPSTCPSNTTWTLSISNSTPSATVAIACLDSNNNPFNVTLGSTNAGGNGTFTGVAAWGTQTYMDCYASVGGTVVASIHFIP